MCAFQSLFPHIYLANTLLLCTITSLRMSVHFHKYLQHFAAKDYPLITPVPAPSNLLQFWKKKKKRNTPNYNLIYHPEAGIIFHLSPNPPYSPLLLFPSPPSIVITRRLEMDPSRVSRSHVTVNDPRQPRRSLTPVRRANGQFTFRQRRLSSGRCERKLDGPPCRVPHFSLFLGITCLRTCNYGRSHRGFEKCRAITERSSLACYEV